MKKRSREVIRFTKEEFIRIITEEHTNYFLIESDIVDVDNEGFIKKEFIVRRDSDNKFFRGIYHDQNIIDGIWFDDPELTEVFPKKVTRQVYE